MSEYNKGATLIIESVQNGYMVRTTLPVDSGGRLMPDDNNTYVYETLEALAEDLPNLII